MDGQSKEDAYRCDHLEKFELATLSSHVDVEIFVFFWQCVDLPTANFFCKDKVTSMVTCLLKFCAI